MLTCRSKNYNCPLEFAIDIIGGKWKTRIIWFLGQKTMRFGELEKMLPDTSRKVLIQQLKELECDEIIYRKVYAQVPPKVEYSLTERGRKLIEPLATLRLWGDEHIVFLNQHNQNQVN